MKTILLLFVIAFWLWGAVVAQDKFDASNKKEWKASSLKKKQPIKAVETHNVPDKVTR